MQHFIYRLVAIALLLSIAVGCSAPNVPTLNDGQRAVCESLNALRTSAVSLRDIDPNTSIEQLRGMRESVGNLVEAARRANTVLQNQSITEMVTAYDGFSRTVDGLNTEQTAGDAATALRASADQVLAALEQAYTAAQCAQ
jgi:uncharacterized protein YcfL